MPYFNFRNSKHCWWNFYKYYLWNFLDFYPVEWILVFFYIMATNKKHTDIQKGEVVQAVVIADSFDSKFGPLTTTRPRVSKQHLCQLFFKIYRYTFFIIVSSTTCQSTYIKLYLGFSQNFWSWRMFCLLCFISRRYQNLLEILGCKSRI